MPKMTVLCDYCEQPAELVNGEVIYPHREDLAGLKFWRCWPCRAYVGCHKGSKNVPLGRLANLELREWRQRAHAEVDLIWELKVKSRKSTYRWLADKLGIEVKDCHIAQFDIEQCQRVIEVCLRGLVK